MMSILEASKVVKPWAHLHLRELPPLPGLTDLAGLPGSLAALSFVYSQASTPQAQERAMNLLLEHAGFTPQQIWEIMNSDNGFRVINGKLGEILEDMRTIASNRDKGETHE